MKNYLFDFEQDALIENEPYLNNGIIPVCFRDLIPEINNTGYLTHSVYYYPAKFIPQVVKYCIKNFSKINDIIIDPFAGSGTVGLEAYLNNRNSYLLDLNLLLNHIIPIKIPDSKNELKESILRKKLDSLIKSNEKFIPNWSNYEYWYPKEFFDVLSKYWGYIKKDENDIYAKIIESVLVKLSKFYSYAEHKTPKLFKSKTKQILVGKLLKEDWKAGLRSELYGLSIKTLLNINTFIQFCKDKNNYVVYHGGSDSASYKYDDIKEFDLLVSSPPYLQAQEYIRTSKMDLYWLGYNDADIKKLSSLEIPYRKPNKIIETETLSKLKESIQRKDLTRVLDSYFCYVLQSFENSMNLLKKNSRACIFIGNPRIDGIEVEIWRIIKEYFTPRGFVFENVYEDKIKTRQLFKMRNNKNPEGMKSEFLLVLRKR